MLKFVLLLTISAACCMGQRRWAGSYGRTGVEDTVLWDSGNYQTSTEDTIKYDHSGKWPADNWKGRDVYGATTTSYNPPSRRDEYDPRMDVRPDRRIIKGISPTMSDINDKRQQDHPTLEDEHYRRKIHRPSIVDEREYYPDNTRKGEEPRENRQIPKIEEQYNTRKFTEHSKGDAGEEYEEPSRGRKGHQLASTADSGNRQRDDIAYKAHRQIPETRKDERSEHAEYDRPRDQPKIIVHHDEKGHFHRDDESEQSSRKGEMDGKVGYDRTPIESKPEKAEDTHATRQHRGNNKGDIGKGYEQSAWNQDRRRFQPSSTENYNNRRREEVSYTGYREISETERSKNDRTDIVREHGRPIDQPKIYVNEDEKSEAPISTDSSDSHRQNSRDEMKGRAGYGVTTVKERQNQEGRQVPEHSRKGSSYDYNRQQEEGLRAREYDRRREEELKRKEYERRLEEEMRKKDEDREGINVKGTDYNENQKEIRRIYVRGEGMINGSEYNAGTSQRIKGIGEQREQNRKGILPHRNQEELSGSEYISRDVSYSRSDEINGRNFEAKSEESLKGADYNLRNEKGINERQFMGKGEERRQPPRDLRYENGRRHENMKGTDNIGKQNGDTHRRESVQDKRETTGTKYSERKQEDRTDRSHVGGNAKGEAYDREMDHVIKRLNYEPILSVSREHNGGIRRTTGTTIYDGDDSHLRSPIIKEYNIRQDNKNWERTTTEHSLIRGSTDDRLKPTGSNQGDDKRLNHEISQHNTSTIQQRNIDNYRITTSNGNSKEQKGVNFKATSAPPYAEANRPNARRTNAETFPNYEERKVPRNDDVINPVYNDRNIKGSSFFVQAKTASNYPIPTDSRSNTRKQVNDNWKSSRVPPDTYGYHPNVSYDTIVFVDYESDDESNVRNFSNQKSEEPSHTVDAERDDYRTGRRDPRKNGRPDRQLRNEERIALTSGATEARRRSNRASTQYSVQETRHRLESLPQMDEPFDIHPDVEILPGYGTTRQVGHRNYNDDVIDDEVELFSSREIKVNTRRYRTNETVNITGDRNPNGHNDTGSNRTSLQSALPEELVASGLADNGTTAFNRKNRTFPSRSEASETSTANPFPAKSVPSSSSKTDLSERSGSGFSRLPRNSRH